MTRKSLAEQAREQQIPADKLIFNTIERVGSVLGAAQELGIAPSLISYYLKTRGKKVVTEKVTRLVDITESEAGE